MKAEDDRALNKKKIDLNKELLHAMYFGRYKLRMKRAQKILQSLTLKTISYHSLSKGKQTRSLPAM